MSEFDDKPITSPDGDRFGFDPLAKALAASISKMEAPDGTVIAVNGPWGSGKSSVINLVKHHLRNGMKTGDLKIVEFKCWWFRGEEALTLAFFQELYSAMEPAEGDTARETIVKLGPQLLMKTSPVVGAILNVMGGPGSGTIASAVMKAIGGLIEQDETVEKLHRELAKALKDSSKRYLVMIDDIDRLSPDEAILIFRLIKSVGELPNVIYLLAYDRQLAEKIVTQHYPSEGPHYLEKIVQASFELPEPSRLSLDKEFERCLYSIIEENEFEDEVYSANLFREIIAPEIKTPRDVLRILNPLRVTWPAVKGEVHPTDFLCLETLRIQRPGLYRTLRSNKGRLTGGEENIRLLVAKPSPKDYDEIFLKQVPPPEHERLRRGLIRLFPALRRVWLDQAHTDNFDMWDRQRRVCSPGHFDTYFRFALPDDVLSRSEVEELISRSDEPDFMQDSFLRAAEVLLPTGGTKVSSLLQAFITYADDMPEEKIGSMLASIYSVADSLVGQKEQEMRMSVYGTTMPGLRLLTRKLTTENFSLEDRSEVLLKACEGATLGCLVFMAGSAYGDHFASDQSSPKSPEEYLTTRDHALKLKDLAVERIRKAAADGSLINCPLLRTVLFWWREVGGGDEDVRIWGSAVIKEDVAVARLARALTGVSSESFLGDSVPKRRFTAMTDGLKSVVDLGEFRARAEQVAREGKLPSEDREVLVKFLDAWRRQDEDDHDDS